jgi:hypothetical protein
MSGGGPNTFDKAQGALNAGDDVTQAQRLAAASKLMELRQKGPASTYAILFREIALPERSGANGTVLPGTKGRCQRRALHEGPAGRIGQIYCAGGSNRQQAVHAAFGEAAHKMSDVPHERCESRN